MACLIWVQTVCIDYQKMTEVATSGERVYPFSAEYNMSLERSGSVVECLSPDRGVAGSSLTGVTMLCP